VFSDRLRNAYGRLVAMYDIWTTKIVSGETGIGGGFGRAFSIFLVLLVVIVACIVYEATEKWKDGAKGKAKAAFCGIATVGLLYTVLAVAVAFGLGDPVHGWNPFAMENEPETPAQTIHMLDSQGKRGQKREDVAPEVTTGENWVRFDWWTDKPARCKAEVMEIRMVGDEDFVHPVYKPRSNWFAQSEKDGSMFHHTYTFNDLAIGETVVLRMKAFGTEGDAKGYTTVLREFKVTVDPNPSPAVHGPAPVASSSASSSASPPPAQTAVPNAGKGGPKPTVPPTRVASAKGAKADENLSSEEVDRRFDNTLKELGIDP
jgi:hypothetical protein